MNRYLAISIAFHALILFSILGLSTEEELKFKEKNTMLVSVKSRRGISGDMSLGVANNFGNGEKLGETGGNDSQNYGENNDNIGNEVKEEKMKSEEPKSQNMPDIKHIVSKKTTEKNGNLKEKEAKTVEKQENTKRKDIKSGAEQKENRKIENTSGKQGTGKAAGSETAGGYSEFQDSSRFLQGTDGIFTASSSGGIGYEILREVDPQYPLKARKMGYTGQNTVKVRFLVDTDGRVKNIKFLSEDDEFGFKQEVEKALKQWKFKPIVYKGKPIRVNFEKEFKFKR